MSEITSPLDWGPVSLVRRNHGLEHATINLLSQKYPNRGFAGHSDSRGFWIIGEISTDELAQTVQEALARMKAGESGLAIHEHCGTNAVTSGVIAGTAAWLSMLGTGNNWKKKLDRLPFVILVVTGAFIASQPLGPKVQAAVTTSGRPGNLIVKQITRFERELPGKPDMHRVETGEGLTSGEPEPA